MRHVVAVKLQLFERRQQALPANNIRYRTFCSGGKSAYNALDTVCVDSHHMHTIFPKYRSVFAMQKWSESNFRTCCTGRSSFLLCMASETMSDTKNEAKTHPTSHC